MNLPFERVDQESEITPAKKLLGRVAGLYVAEGDSFETAGSGSLHLGLKGIKGDLHSGFSRKSGGREPWYTRGTKMRNERQLSIVSTDELAIVARRMGIDEIKPEWVGANMVIDGVPQLSMIPSGTLLFFRGGVTIKVDAQNGPCRFAGAMVAKRAGMADEGAGALEFPKAAKRLRGLVGWVEKPGQIERDEDVSVRIPEQWIYSG